MDDSRAFPAAPRIDIVSDVVCPWCVIGYRQLEQALAAAGMAAEIHWHPFELNPSMPPEGQNMREHVMQKYGSTAEQSQASRERITALGAETGFRFAWDDETRMWNTFLAHQLIEWAVRFGAQHRVNLALFRAHFTEGRNVSDIGVLAEVAEECGLDPVAARAALEAGETARDVRSIQQFWASKGIEGVPAMIFDQRYLLTGAQGVQGYAAMLDRLTREPG
ncbi:DsbA family oxidoreductase [Aquicoccus sp. SCR17]|nr:DsbA family oxidoreductase [Carideicomes alvinocaridis]